MATTPQITLTANLESILGGPVGGADPGGYLRITLCGYGLQIPAVPGTCMIADAGVPRLVGPQAGSTPLSTELWGNDVITPDTFYEISVLDQNKNVIQSGVYQFSGTETIDLSQAPQFIPPYGFSLQNLAYVTCTGSGNTYTAAAAKAIIAVAYNGILLAYDDPSRLSYTASGDTITLNFSTSLGDRIDAICIV